MNNASLELGGDNWAAKDTKLLASTVSDDSGRFYPREFTFSRGSNLSATRVNADGNIEKGYENLLLQSNSFLTTWTQVSISPPTSGQAGYDGSTDAWYFEKTGAFGRLQQSISTSGVQTLSVYLKAKDSSWVNIEAGGTNTSRQYFNLTAPIETAKGSSSNIISSSIEDAGNGWRKCSITYEGTKTFVFIFIAEGNGQINGTSGSLYIQDAMLNQGIAALPYIESGSSTAKAGILENEPRIDYSSGTPSLLLEPSRTQLVKQSEYYSGSDWISSNATITDNVTTSPEGLQNASLINFTSSGNYFQHQGPAIVSGSTYTISCYVKRAISTDQVFKIYGNNNKASANLTATSEWQRFTHTFTADSTNFASGLSAPSTAQIHLYGFQVELGSYPTSYIPTYGTSQTRGADRPQILNTTTDVLSQTAFTLFFEADLTSDTTNNFKDIVAFRGPSKELRFETRIDNSVRVQSNMITSGDTFNSATIGDTDNKKFAMTFTTSQVRLYADGSLVSTYNGAYSSDLVHILFMNSTSLGVETKTNFKQYLLFTSALSDNECIELTTI